MKRLEDFAVWIFSDGGVVVMNRVFIVLLSLLGLGALIGVIFFAAWHQLFTVGFCAGLSAVLWAENKSLKK